MVVCAACAIVGAAFSARAWTQRDNQPTLDAKAVQQVEAALQKQREQLMQLQSHLAQSLTGVGGCVDRWAVQYPLETDKWDGHSCSWKKKWGQCAEFVQHCAQTCGTWEEAVAFLDADNLGCRADRIRI